MPLRLQDMGGLSRWGGVYKTPENTHTSLLFYIKTAIYMMPMLVALLSDPSKSIPHTTHTYTHTHTLQKKPTQHHQLVTPLPRSHPPLSCLSGFTIFPSRTVNLTIRSQSSGLTLASQIHWLASPSGSASPRRYTITFAANLWPPTWLMKKIPTPPGRWSWRSR